MRVFFSGMPGAGHILPLMPLARAFRERGDEVAVATAAGLERFLAGEDMDFLPTGPGADFLISEVARLTGQNLWEGVTDESEADLFAAVRVDLALEETLATARTWQPDLIVAEHYDLLAPLVGAILGVPVAVLAYGPAMPPRHAVPMEARLRPRYEARGLMHGPARWYLDTCPPSLQNPGWTPPAGRIGLRPEAHRGPRGEKAAPAGPVRGRPRVLVTFGTMHASPKVMGSLLRELLAEDLDLRVTSNGSALADFGLDPEQADRVEFADFTPLAELLRDVDVFLTHGGAGSVLGALSSGLPMVVVPQGADQPLQAERVAASGAGISFPLREADPGAVAKAVGVVLADPGYRNAARRISREIEAYGTPPSVAARISADLGR